MTAKTTAKLHEAIHNAAYWKGRCDEAQHKKRAHKWSDKVVKAREALFQANKKLNAGA